LPGARSPMRSGRDARPGSGVARPAECTGRRDRDRDGRGDQGAMQGTVSRAAQGPTDLRSGARDRPWEPRSARLDPHADGLGNGEGII
jgi:hypothetical protein